MPRDARIANDRVWLCLSVPVSVACAAIGWASEWSSTSVTFVVAMSGAYLMFPPMMASLRPWETQPVHALPAGSVGEGEVHPRADRKSRRPTGATPPRWDPGLTAVLHALADGLPDEEDRASVRDLAGVRAGHVATARSPHNAWQALLAAAVDQGRLEPLFDAAAQRNSRVAVAVQDYLDRA